MAPPATVLRFLQDHSRALAFVLIAIACIRIVATYSELSITVDEPGHFACGLEYLSKHVYRYESQHPPLTRAMEALGPYLDGARLLNADDRNREGMEVIFQSPRPERALILMRLGILPFFLLACLVVYFWSTHHFGGDVAVIATGLFTLIPPVLAHAGLGTTDMGLAASVSAAFLALILWAESPTPFRTIALGVSSALAALTKFTALGYVPASAILALACVFVIPAARTARVFIWARDRIGSFLVAVLIGAVTIWSAYWFSFGTVPAWNIRLPAPEFFDGISVALHHNVEGHQNYLMGEVSNKGWWYYFPIVLAVKTPIGFLILVAIGIVYTIRAWANVRILLPLAFALGILVPAMTSNVNIGVRHILPIYCGLSIIAAFAVTQIIRTARSAAIVSVLAILILWTALSGATHHPDYLSYFNGFAGGEPQNVLVDSDLDWGQNTKRLAGRLRELGVKEVSLHLVGPAAEAVDFEKWYGMPHVVRFNESYPNPGWNVVSVMQLSMRNEGVDLNLLRQGITKSWAYQIAPTERLGPLLLFNIPADFKQRPQ
ncbi:MAG: glycosyl transferase [Terriglobia bacterium]|nr:MAG: glycosyl transferase [Terriglobia bacterium]